MPNATKRWYGILVATLIPFGSAVWAQQAEEPADIDPLAAELLSSATTFLAQHDKMSVNWLVSFDQIVDGREKITRTRSGQNILSRGEGFYSFTENGPDTREYFFDGASFQIFDVEENAYVLAPFTGDFENLVNRARAEYDVVLPIWSIMSRHSENELLKDAEKAAYLGQTRIAGRDVHHLALSNYDHDWQVWIAADPDQPELVMLVGTDPYTQGWPQYRVYFSEWDFAPEIPEGAFTFIPDEEAERMSWPKVATEVGKTSPLAETGSE